jgi:hypothetical protein
VSSVWIIIQMRDLAGLDCEVLVEPGADAATATTRSEQRDLR